MHGPIVLGNLRATSCRRAQTDLGKGGLPGRRADLDAMAEHVDRSANHEQAEAQADG